MFEVGTKVKIRDVTTTLYAGFTGKIIQIFLPYTYIILMDKTDTLEGQECWAFLYHEIEGMD